MTVINPPGFLQNAGDTHTAEQFRNWFSGLLSGTNTASSLIGRGGVNPSSGNKLQVTQAGSPAMSVVVKSGHAYIPGTEGSKQGVYAVLNDADVTLTIGASHATLHRIDLVVFKVEDSAYSGVANTSSLVVVAGTPASSPVAPAAPANSIILAQVSIVANDTSITNGEITDRRTYVAAAGGILTVANETERNAQFSTYDGQATWRRDLKRFDVKDGAGGYELIGAPTLIKAVRIINNGNPVATTSGTTELNWPLYAISSLNLVTGRYYMYRFLFTFTKTVAGDTFDFRLRANTAVSGTLITGSATDATDNLTIGHRYIDFLFIGDSSYTSLHLSIVRAAGSGTLSYFSATTGNRAWAQLYDMGGNWTDVS